MSLHNPLLTQVAPGALVLYATSGDEESHKSDGLRDDNACISGMFSGQLRVLINTMIMAGSDSAARWRFNPEDGAIHEVLVPGWKCGVRSEPHDIGDLIL